MQILVTGGAGFIGSTLVRQLLDDGARVVVLDAFTSAANPLSLEGLGAEVVQGSVTDAALVDELVAGVDAVLHLAAESHVDTSLTSPTTTVTTNVMGTLAVLEAVRRHGTRLHHVSTDEVFGDLPLDGGSFTRDSCYRPSSPYAASKASADHLVRAWVRSYGIAATISVCGNNYGPRQHVEKFIPRQITTLLDDGRPRLYGNGRQVRDWVHVDDHCAALRRILAQGQIGATYLVSSRCERSNQEIVAALLQEFGRDSTEVDFVVDRPGHDQRYALDPSSTMIELGWQPQIDFAQGLRETVAWYRDNRHWWQPHKAAAEAAAAARGQ